MTAQSLIARDAADPARVRRMARLLLRLGLVAAAGLAAALAATYLALPRLFTKDDAVAAAVRPLTPQVSHLCLLRGQRPQNPPNSDARLSVLPVWL